jgi:hypothetical protein
MDFCNHMSPYGTEGFDFTITSFSGLISKKSDPSSRQKEQSHIQ